MRACSLNLLQVESTFALEIWLPQGAAAEVVEIFNLSSSQLIFHDPLFHLHGFFLGSRKKKFIIPCMLNLSESSLLPLPFMLSQTLFDVICYTNF
jgi:hypothetical protein